MIIKRGRADVEAVPGTEAEVIASGGTGRREESEQRPGQGPETENRRQSWLLRRMPDARPATVAEAAYKFTLTTS